MCDVKPIDIEGKEVKVTHKVTWRAFIIGLVGVSIVCLWIHYAELVLGGTRGHTALANTSIPIGAFDFLFAVVLVNLILAKFKRSWSLSQPELIVIYVMTTTGTVIASAGGIHFLVPAIAAAFYYASPENQWETLFHSYIPKWIAVRDPEALRGFYLGHSTIPVRIWLVPMLVWTGFLSVFMFTTLCLCAILRKQWVDRERLTFPTLFLPLEVTKEGGAFFKNKWMWLGFLIPFSTVTLNTLNMNFPMVPHIEVRGIGAMDLGQYIVNRPWNAIGSTPLALYPFIIGIAYLISLEVTFSCWFFYFFTKLQRMFGLMMGWYEPGFVSPLNRFPFLGHQGAGAFLGLTFFSLLLARRYFAEVFHSLLGKSRILQETGEPLPYRWAVWGLIGSFLVLLGFCKLAGMSLLVPAVLLGLALTYMVAATRIRAETGNAWLMGPEVDPYTVMTTTFGTAGFSAVNLTIMAYLRSISTYDLRQLAMPHQLDAFKMADMVKVKSRQVALVIMIAIVIGIVVAFWSGLAIWYKFGAEAKCDAWRTWMGRQPFDILKDSLETPKKPDNIGTLFILFGFAFCGFLTFMRMRFVWWPFHPVGYAMAGTSPWSFGKLWFPFFLAWLAKSFVLRYGGMKAYRQTLPFFLGLILGDFASGGLWTLVGCFIPINVYPINW